jgi:hypothetical protein
VLVFILTNTHPHTTLHPIASLYSLLLLLKKQKPKPNIGTSYLRMATSAQKPSATRSFTDVALPKPPPPLFNTRGLNCVTKKALPTMERQLLEGIDLVLFRRFTTPCPQRIMLVRKVMVIKMIMVFVCIVLGAVRQFPSFLCFRTCQ